MFISELLNTVTQTLDSLGIPYMLSGSLALNLYAIPRATRDIDMIVELQEKHVDFSSDKMNSFFIESYSVHFF